MQSCFSHVHLFATLWTVAWLHCTWDSPGNTGVGCYALLQGIFPTWGSSPCLLCFLHWKAVCLPLAAPGNPRYTILPSIKKNAVLPFANIWLFLENIMHGVTKSWTGLSDFTFIFHFHALEKEIATHSSILAWRIPETGEPDGLPSMGSHRVGHDWSDLAAAAENIIFSEIRQRKMNTVWNINNKRKNEYNKTETISQIQSPKYWYWWGEESSEGQCRSRWLKRYRLVCIKWINNQGVLYRWRM